MCTRMGEGTRMGMRIGVGMEMGIGMGIGGWAGRWTWGGVRKGAPALTTAVAVSNFLSDRGSQSILLLIKRANKNEETVLPKRSGHSEDRC